MKTTEEIIQDLKQSNAQRAYGIIMTKYNGSIQELEEHYAKRPYEHVWADVKVLIDVSKTEEFKSLVNSLGGIKGIFKS